MSKILYISLTSLILIFTSCSSVNNQLSKTPSWYISPKQNNSQSLYGVAQGYTLEEATKYALADAASRLMVSISAKSELIREENNVSFNEEMRESVKQNIEKIDFTNFQVSNSAEVKNKFFVEVEIDRNSFINDQKNRIEFINKKISNLDSNSKNTNPIRRRNALIEILDLAKELEIKSRILQGAGKQTNVKDTLNKIAKFQNQLSSLTNNVEFFFEINSPREIAQIVRKQLNKEKIKIATKRSNSANQITIKIKSKHQSREIYGSHITKLEVDFENISQNKILASNSIEVSGSSTINSKNSYKSSLKSFEEKIKEEGILKILGISG